METLSIVQGCSTAQDTQCHRQKAVERKLQLCLDWQAILADAKEKMRGLCIHGQDALEQVVRLTQPLRNVLAQVSNFFREIAQTAENISAWFNCEPMPYPYDSDHDEWLGRQAFRVGVDAFGYLPSDRELSCLAHPCEGKSLASFFHHLHWRLEVWLGDHSTDRPLHQVLAGLYDDLELATDRLREALQEEIAFLATCLSNIQSQPQQHSIN